MMLTFGLTGGNAGLMMLTVAMGKAGINQPDHEHGRPDQSNFADGSSGKGIELGQNTYAKQC
jgi:hypothetical protein